MHNSVVEYNGFVSGNARLIENAKVSKGDRVFFNYVTSDLSLKENLIESIEAQTGLKVFNGAVYGYKHVVLKDNVELCSNHDPMFKYKVGEFVELKEGEYDPSPLVSYGPGLYFSNPHYWNTVIRGNKRVIFIKCNLEDILTVKGGKIRCKKLFVIGICDGKAY